MSFLSNLFKVAPKTIDDVMDKEDGLLVKAGGFINDLHYSDAEKAKDFQKLAQSYNDYVKATLEENTERSITRRGLALRWITAQLALIFISVGMYKWDKEFAEFVWNVATSNVMSFGTIGILAFFFGSHMISSHFGARRKEDKK